VTAAVTDPLLDPAPPLDAEAVEAATDQIRTFCGWHIAPSAPEVITLDGPGGRVLILPTLRLNAVASITVDGVALPSTAYTWTGAGVITRVDGGFWSSKPQSIVASVTHGYAVCPAAVRRELRRLAASPAGGPMGLTQGQIGSLSVTYGPPQLDVSAVGAYTLYG